MNFKIKLLIIGFLVSGNVLFAQSTAKPWAYWWWPASAVNKSDIRANLQSYANAGFGGMHIIPIYGVKGEETNFIHFMSPQYIEILEFTVLEAKKLGMGIDMSLGTGWPFGGKNVELESAAKSLVLTKDSLGVFKANYKNTLQKVKRAAPGGEGLVLDHFDSTSVIKYFATFDSLFKYKNIGIRAFYNDSYEAYGANWTNDFLKQFKRLRYYELEEHLESLTKTKDLSFKDSQIWHDYQETISELLLESFTKSFSSLAHKYGKINRNEAHGSPANILDLYGAVDIPESEFFGSKPYNIPLYRQDPDYEESRFGKPSQTVLKLASSPAHLLNKPLVSSETATWLGNHFKVSLAQIKPIIDESFLGGINHVFFHGVSYSPPNAAFPGWLFYASTNFNQNSHFYNELPFLNKYIENSQKILQNSQAHNQVLLYLPIHELWHKAKESLQMIDVHSLEKNGLFTPEYLKLISDLKTNGYQFDFISDKQILELKKSKTGYGINNLTYKALVIPATNYMPLKTIIQLQSLKKQGLKVLFEHKLPKNPIGYLDYKNNKNEYAKNLESFNKNISFDIISDLKLSKIQNEEIGKFKIEFLRKTINKTSIYFLANQDTVFKSGHIILHSSAKFVNIYDAETGKYFNLNYKKSGNNTAIYLNLEAGKSIFVLFENKDKNYEKYTSNKVIKEIKLTGAWSLEFANGKPFIPKKQYLSNLNSWTETKDTMAHYYSGIGIYNLEFELSEQFINKAAKIKLGDVRESARVYINDMEIGTAWSLPFTLNIPNNILKTKNNIRIEVQNLSANRMIYMDKQKVNWKRFYDINMVDIQYKSFDASNWKPVKSGLLGPVIIEILQN